MLLFKKKPQTAFFFPDYSNAHALRAKSDYFIVKTVHEHQTLVLPCLPSHPNVNVTFLKVIKIKLCGVFEAIALMTVPHILASY